MEMVLMRAGRERKKKYTAVTNKYTKRQREEILNNR
jgi:hypothetical protein